MADQPMKMKGSVKGEIDVGKIQRLVRRDEILIGYPSGVQHGGDGMENAELAKVLHFGSKRIPAREFLTLSLAEQKKIIHAAMKASYQKLMKTGQPEAEKIGAIGVGIVQRFVRGDYFKENVPNAPATIYRKSKVANPGTTRARLLTSDKPLIDTAFLINSTTFVIKKKPKFHETGKKLKAGG
jgi:hypothetical protein